MVMRPLQLRSIRVRWSWFTSNPSLRNGKTPYYKNSELATSKGIGHKMASTWKCGQSIANTTRQAEFLSQIAQCLRRNNPKLVVN